MASSSSPESSQTNRIKAIEELKKGSILTSKLREMSGQKENIESDLDSVVVQILGMFYNTISILQPSNVNGNPQILASDDDQKPKDFTENIKITAPPLKTKGVSCNRRKNVLTISKVTSTLIDDGYAWRKYGRKVIHNWKHQRNYYRCSYKHEQGCQATKQVQKLDGMPSKYKITYNGHHTCNNLQRAPPIIKEAPNPAHNSILISFKTNMLTNNNKVGTCIQSSKHTHNGGSSSLAAMKHEQIVSSDHHTPWGPIMELSQIPSEVMSPIPHALDREEMVSSDVITSTSHTHGYREIDDMIESHGYSEIDDMIESHGYGDLLFDYVNGIM